MPDPRPSLADSGSLLAAVTPGRLRARFLDAHLAEGDRRTLDAVGHMLFEFERIDRVMEIGCAFLAESLEVDRVDIGFGSRRDRQYRSIAEYRAPGAQAPSLCHVDLPNGHDVLQRVWKNEGPVAYDDVDRNPLISPLKAGLGGAQALLARRLADDEGRDLGIICIDELRFGRTWTDENKAHLDDFCRRFLAPIVDLARRLTAAENACRPTPAELQAIRLAAEGLSYKEIARELDKSVRTIEAQLRNARQKTGAVNQTDLVRVCRRWL